MKNGLELKNNGTQVWYLNGKKHRLDGPAVISKSGDEQWFVNGLRHRIDGPALIFKKTFGVSGQPYCEWWVNGININASSNEEFLKLMRLKAFW